MKIVDSEQFIGMLNNGIQEDSTTNINFDDEIISIESVGIRKTYDINIEGKDHFFYANNILTHNSATGSQLDIKNVDNDSVSDSIGTVQTADFIVFLLQTPQMKEENLMTCKVTKNRFNGRTDYWNMNISYEHMRFSDAIVNDQGMNEKEISKEITSIIKEDIEKIKKHDNALKDNFNDMPEVEIKKDFDINELLGLD